MTAQLEADGQRVLRAYTWWQVARILLDPKTAVSDAVSSQYGCSHYLVPGLPNPATADGAWWMTTTRRGIALGDRFLYGGRDAAHLLPWTAVTTHARAMPDSLRYRLAVVMSGHAEHQSAYRPFRASAYSQGCRQPPHAHGHEGPATPQQAAYAAEHDAWLTGHVHPWWDRKHQLEAAVSAVLDEVLPLATEEPDEPTDLLALLAQMEPA